MTKELLYKFLNDQCTEEELKKLVDWIKKDTFKKKEKDLISNDWNNFSTDELFNSEKFGLLLDKIHHKININQQNTTKVKLINKAAKWIVRAAAVLFLPVSISLIYTLSEHTPKLAESNNVIDSLEIVTPVGSQTLVQLSDGSVVYLNHGSKLKYPHKFSKEKREVVLSGEGYFKIAHNPDQPFWVKTSKLNIQAIGTEFNVKAYNDEDFIETTLAEGKVLVQQTNQKNQSKTDIIMTPNQHLDYNIITENISSSKGNIEKYLAWKDGKLIFKNESIVQISKQLSRWYNVDFIFEDEGIKENTYTATFVNETLFQILDLMKIATPVDYRALSRNKLPDGTFSKQIIIFKKRL